MQNAERLIYIDDLSSLYNRRYLYSHLPKELQEAQEQKYSLWLFMLDIDDFKMINDTYGHLYGDEIIREISNIIRENTKSDDKKIRYAGDEFTIILPKLEISDVLNVAERLIARVEAHTFKEKRTGKEINLTVSLGIAGYPQDASDPIELINLADKSLYISKQKGKNCISTVSEITPDLFWKRDILDRFPCSLFIEREAELSKLKGALQETLRHQGQLILITGEMGIGKSRLLAEFENIVVSSGKTVPLATRCEEKFLLQSYYAIGEILYRYLSELDKLPEGALNGITQTMLGELFNFMPVLKRVSQANTIEDFPKEENSLTCGLIKLLQNISKIKPLCLFFDDAQYLDQQSLEIIRRLTQENKEFPILILGAFSGQDVSTPEMAPSPFATFFKDGMLQNSSEVLTLTRLTAEGTKKLITSIFAIIPLSSNLIDLIYKITKGNPLFVEELLKYLIEKEYIVYKNGKWIESQVNEAQLPLSVEDTIRKRIDELSPETKEMIAKAAVIGDDFQVDLLQKIDSEDKGYILDLIEAGKKVGLIYEKEGTGRDEFSFVTGEIRKVLFNLVGNNQMKHLHSRLGEIKEKLYPDKISSIAGELYYNFKKAEDWVRAEQYAKIMKEGTTAFYDRAMKYAESLLHEAEEEKVALPLSKKAMMIIPEIIRSIYIASINCFLYPPKSKIILQSQEEIYERLLEVLAETDVLMLAYFEGELIVNNKRVSKEPKIFFLERFISLLKNSNIESIRFKKGVGQEEISKFIDIINNPKNIEEGLSLIIEESGISHIKINEINYGPSKVKSREKESLQEIMLIDYLLGKLPPDGKRADFTEGLSAHAKEITQALDKLAEQASKESGKEKESVKAELMVKSIQKIGNQFIKEGKDNWAKYREDLAKTILSMEPNLRAKIFSNQPQDSKEADVIKELSLGMPDDIIMDVLTRQYQQKDISLEKIKTFAQRFLSIPEKKEKISPLLKEKLNQLGAIQEESDWILGEETWDKLSWKEKADKILSFPIKNLFKLIPMIKVDSLIKELLSEQKEALVEVITEKLFILLTEEYPQSKSLTSYFSKVLDVFIQDSPQKIFPKFIQKLAKACVDKEELFSSILTLHLEETINLLLADGHLDLLKETMQIYAKNAGIIDNLTQTLEPVIYKLIKELTRRIDFNLDWSDLVETLVLFGNNVTRLLIEEALFEKGVESGKYFEAYLRRFTIGKILNRLPKENIRRFLKEKSADLRPYIVKNLIELIGATEDDELIKILEIPLKHTDAVIRKKVIFVLGKLKGKESAVLLGEALKDTDASLRKHALDILKSRKDNFALQALTEQRNDKGLPDDIRQGL